MKYKMNELIQQARELCEKQEIQRRAMSWHGCEYSVRSENVLGVARSASCIKTFPDCICNRCANEQARMKPCCNLHGVRCNGNQECKDSKEEQEND